MISRGDHGATPNLPTDIVGFRGFDSSIILIYRGGIPRPIGDFPESFESSNVSRDNVSREIGRKLPREAPLRAKYYTLAITKVKLHRKMPLKIHWTIPVNIHWESDNPLRHATDK